MGIFESNEWKPLEDAIPEEEYENYMFMGTTESGIHRYKNINTRRYLNIDSNGNFYYYDSVDKTYLKISKKFALEWVNS